MIEELKNIHKKENFLTLYHTLLIKCFSVAKRQTSFNYLNAIQATLTALTEWKLCPLTESAKSLNRSRKQQRK